MNAPGTTPPDAGNPAPLAPDRSPRPVRSLRKKRNPWPARIVIVLVLAAAVGLVIRSSKTRPIAVETTRVERTAVRDEISSATAGEVMAERTATVRSELSGRVLAIRHKRGERVKRGDAVVALDAADLDARLQQAQATLEAQRAQAEQADAHAEAAGRTAERLRKLAAQGAETASASDDATSLARESITAARAAHAQAEQSAAAVRVARVARTRADLTAPFDGLLADVFVNLGDELPMGANVFEIVDDSRLHVEATIDEADISKVRPGQPASLRLDAMPNRPIEGAVTKLDPTVRKDEKGARTLRIEVEVKDLHKALEQGLRPGMSANVDVRVAEKANVLSLPTNVIVGRGTKRSVYAVDQGVARERTIAIGMSSWERTEIVSGVAEGSLVITNLNAKGLADGVPVIAGGDHAP